MGGRGASSGISNKGKKYGTEYTTLYQTENIKFVRYNDGAAKTPMETMAKNRVYATVNEKNELRSITFYDVNNKRYKQIDVAGTPHIINGKEVMPHSHMGYFHNENGDFELSEREKKMVAYITEKWYNHLDRR